MPKLALGTVQFGLAYGLSRPDAPVSLAKIREILRTAWEAEVDMLDTAPVYGDAEKRIGASRPAAAQFSVVSKVARFAVDEISAADIAQFQSCVRRSLEQLGTDRLYALLVHSPDDLLKPGASDLVRALVDLKSAGLTERIGVSVYDRDMLDAVAGILPYDLVQLPLNVLDQRLARDGTIRSLAARGIEVHVRSVFLQGVLLLWPDALPPRLAGAREQVLKFWRVADEAGLSPPAAALSYVVHQEGVSRIVIGVDDVASLTENLEAMRVATSRPMPAALNDLGLDDLDVVDPRRWVD
ncbi:aldo/keto reductase [Hyphomicrobium sp.]|uniref:aldo/keto reductase n=1 Tax=Hyphomicrobium sp. TaxID=82 RepID=UPI0025C1486C|nr:aldo/keto reductase [Hyphomicrobium sp.]MCC7250956.1 aldo/keto reductase [Hyphomicrobium sp.]